VWTLLVMSRFIVLFVAGAILPPALLPDAVRAGFQWLFPYWAIGGSIEIWTGPRGLRSLDARHDHRRVQRAGARSRAANRVEARPPALRRERHVRSSGSISGSRVSSCTSVSCAKRSSASSS
jgi:hypothetical protein